MTRIRFHRRRWKRLQFHQVPNLPWTTRTTTATTTSTHWTIRSLRVVNTFFYNAFDEFCGWSRCALAIKREYRILRNNDNSFVTWRFMLRAEALRANHHLPTPPGWTREQRRHIGKVVSKAMERKKLSVYRCKQLIWMLDRRPRLSLKGGLWPKWVVSPSMFLFLKDANSDCQMMTTAVCCD